MINSAIKVVFKMIACICKVIDKTRTASYLVKQILKYLDHYPLNERRMLFHGLCREFKNGQ